MSDKSKPDKQYETEVPAQSTDPDIMPIGEPEERQPHFVNLAATVAAHSSMNAELEVSAYASAANSLTTPEDKSAVWDLEKIYPNLPSPELYAIAFDDEPVAPRIGGSVLTESTLKVLAGYEWQRRVALDSERQARESERRTNLRWLVSTLIASPIIGALLIYFGYWLKN